MDRASGETRTSTERERYSSCQVSAHVEGSAHVNGSAAMSLLKCEGREGAYRLRSVSTSVTRTWMRLPTSSLPDMSVRGIRLWMVAQTQENTASEQRNG